MVSFVKLCNVKIIKQISLTNISPCDKKHWYFDVISNDIHLNVIQINEYIYEHVIVIYGIYDKVYMITILSK